MSAITIEAQRERLFRALAVLHVCRHAMTSKTDGLDADSVATALQVAHDLVDDVAAELDVLDKGD